MSYRLTNSIPYIGVRYPGFVRRDMVYYSRVTKKGQTTIPAEYRRKYGLGEGVTVMFTEINRGLLIRPKPDITDSAGALSAYAEARAVISDLLKAREEAFR